MQIAHFSSLMGWLESVGEIKINFTLTIIVVCCLALNTEQSYLIWLSLIDYAQTFFYGNCSWRKKKLEIILLIIWLLLVLRLHFNHTQIFFLNRHENISPYNSFDVELSISWYNFLLVPHTRTELGSVWIIKLCVIIFSAFVRSVSGW